MTRLPTNYPRRTVRIAVEHLLRHPVAIADRAERDKIVILRAGKPCWVLMNHGYYRLLLKRAGRPDVAEGGRHRAVGLVKRRFRSRRGP